MKLFDTTNSLLKKHFGIIILSIVVSIFTFGPQMFAINSMGDSFRGVYPINTADDVYYLARAKDVVDGHRFLANPYLYEHKDSSSMQFWLPDYLLAKPLSILNVSVAEGYIFYDFLLAIVLTVLTYSIFYLLTKARVISFSFTAFLHLALFLGEFTRSPSPQLNFIFWLMLALFLIKYIQTKKRIYSILSILALGLLFYIYPYYWTFYIATLFIFVVLGLFFIKKFNFEAYLYIFLGALIIGTPYFISLYQSMQLPYYQESIYRLGMIETRFPSGIKIVFLASILLVIGFILYKKKIIKINSLSLLLFSGTISSVVSVNQHVITGKNLEFSSHYWLLSVFWFSFLVAYYLNKILNNTKLKFIYSKITLSLVLLVFIFSFFNARAGILSDAKAKDYEIHWQRYMNIFNWLNQNTDKESVIYANNELSQLSVIYTGNNVFYARPANFHFISDDEVFERFIINNYHEDFSKEFIMNNMRSIWGVHYIDEYGHQLTKNKIKKVLGQPTTDLQLIPDDAYSNFITLKDNFLQSSFKELLTKYRTDYIVWDKDIELHWNLEQYDFLREVYQSNSIIVFKIYNE